MSRPYTPIYGDSAKIVWENRPSTATPLASSNLNKESQALHDIDARLVEVGNSSILPSDISTVIKNVTFEESTGIFTFTRYNDTTYTLDTKLEKVVTNWTYDSATQCLVLTLADGSTVSIDISSMISEYDFEDTTSIAFTVANHKVTANIVAHSIGENQLETGYLTACLSAVSDAEGEADNAEAWAVGKKNNVDVPSTEPQYHNNAKYYSELASQSEQNASDYSEDSEAWSNGQRNGVDVPNTDPAYHNNAKYWKDQAQAIVGGEDNVKYTAQTKTEAEKTIARTNIGAISGRFDKDDTDWDDETSLSSLEDGYYEIKGTNHQYEYFDFPSEWYSAWDDGDTLRTHLIVQSDYLQNNWLTLISQNYTNSWSPSESVRVWMMYNDGNQGMSDWQVVSNISDGGGLLPHIIITCETGTTITLTKGGTSISATETSTGQYEADVTEYGTYTITATKNGLTATSTLVVDDVKIYNTSIVFFIATITVTYPLGATCVLSATGQASQTASGSPYTFTVHEATTYTITTTLDGASKSEIVVITTNGQSESVAISYGTITVNIPDNMKGQSFTCVKDGTTITKTAPNDSNTFDFYPPTTGTWVVTGAYSQSATVNTLSTPISVTFIALKTFATATDAEIAAMVSLADNGVIDLYDDCGWRVGQEHEVSLSAISASGTYDGVSWSVGESQPAQTVTLVLMHKGLYELVNATASGRTTCSFVVGMKDMCYTAGYMNANTSDNTGWDGCARRSWCNGGFRQAIPSELRSAFKQFKAKTIQRGGSNTTLVTSNDYFALPAEKEIYGEKNRGTDTEANVLTQFTWYETSSNRAKTGVHGAVWNEVWRQRTPHSSASFPTYFLVVDATGSEQATNCADALGISPFGCV